MLEFTSLDFGVIRDHGDVYAVPNPFCCNDFGHLVGHKVKINGRLFLCTGVCFPHEAPWRAGETIGLLVRDEGW